MEFIDKILKTKLQNVIILLYVNQFIVLTPDYSIANKSGLKNCLKKYNLKTMVIKSKIKILENIISL